MLAHGAQAALFTRGKQPRCPSEEEWMSTGSIHNGTLPSYAKEENSDTEESQGHCKKKKSDKHFSEVPSRGRRWKGGCWGAQKFWLQTNVLGDQALSSRNVLFEPAPLPALSAALVWVCAETPRPLCPVWRVAGLSRAARVPGDTPTPWALTLLLPTNGSLYTFPDPNQITLASLGSSF